MNAGISWHRLAQFFQKGSVNLRFTAHRRPQVTKYGGLGACYLFCCIYPTFHLHDETASGQRLAV